MNENLEKKITKNKILLVEENMDFLKEALGLSAKQETFYEVLQSHIQREIKQREEENVKLFTPFSVFYKLDPQKQRQEKQGQLRESKFEEITPGLKRFYKNRKELELLTELALTSRPEIDFDIAINSISAIDKINALKYDAVITSDLFDSEVELGSKIKGRCYDDAEQGLNVMNAALENKVKTYVVSAPKGARTFPSGYQLGSGDKTTAIRYDEKTKSFAKENNIPFIEAKVNQNSRIAHKNFEKAVKLYFKEKNEETPAFLNTSPRAYLMQKLDERADGINKYVAQEIENKRLTLTTKGFFELRQKKQY